MDRPGLHTLMQRFLGSELRLGVGATVRLWPKAAAGGIEWRVAALLLKQPLG